MRSRQVDISDPKRKTVFKRFKIAQVGNLISRVQKLSFTRFTKCLIELAEKCKTVRQNS